jgi:regulator of replication initiation timing
MDIEELTCGSSLTTDTELKVDAKTLYEELKALKAEVQDRLLQENELRNEVTTLRQELAENKAQRKHNLPKKALKGGEKALKGGLNQMKKLTKLMNASWSNSDNSLDVDLPPTDSDSDSKPTES